MQVSLSFFLPFLLWAQAFHSPISTPYILTGAYSRHFLGPFSFLGNQACLGSQEKLAIGTFSENRFMVEGLNLGSMTLSLPLADGGIGIRLGYFGFADYNESIVGLAYGRSLGKMASLGIQFNYTAYHITGYGNSGAMSIEIGALFHPAENIRIGCYTLQAAGGNSGNLDGEKLSSIYKMGIGYEASEQVFGILEIIKEESQQVSVNAALHYAFAQAWFAGIGIMTATASPYGWAGWAWKDLRVDIIVSHHPQLGYSPGIMLQVGSVLSKKEGVGHDP
jgi:hypothetical protein